MAYITVKNNQSIWDLALQYYGDAAGVKQLIIDNPSVLNFSDDIPPGTKILISTDPINKPIVDYLLQKGIALCTAVKIRNWILESSHWDDNGTWYDTSIWKDGTSIIISTPAPITG